MYCRNPEAKRAFKRVFNNINAVYCAVWQNNKERIEWGWPQFWIKGGVFDVWKKHQKLKIWTIRRFFVGLLQKRCKMRKNTILSLRQIVKAMGPAEIEATAAFIAGFNRKYGEYEPKTLKLFSYISDNTKVENSSDDEVKLPFSSNGRWNLCEIGI